MDLFQKQLKSVFLQNKGAEALFEKDASRSWFPIQALFFAIIAIINIMRRSKNDNDNNNIQFWFGIWWDSAISHGHLKLSLGEGNLVFYCMVSERIISHRSFGKMIIILSFRVQSLQPQAFKCFFQHTSASAGLSMNILGAGDKSLVQRGSGQAV